MLLPSILLVALAFGLTLLWLELRHRLRPASPLRLSSGAWRVQRFNAGGSSGEQGDAGARQCRAERQPHPAQPPPPHGGVRAGAAGQSRAAGPRRRPPVRGSTRVTPHHPDEEARSDGYWFAYILKGRKSTEVEVSGADQPSGRPGPRAPCSTPSGWRCSGSTTDPSAGSSGATESWSPCASPECSTEAEAPWREGERCRVLPIRTHLLGVLDDPEAGAAALRRPPAAARRHPHHRRDAPGGDAGPLSPPLHGGALDAGPPALPGVPSHQQPGECLRAADPDRSWWGRRGCSAPGWPGRP